MKVHKFLFSNLMAMLTFALTVAACRPSPKAVEAPTLPTSALQQPQQTGLPTLIPERESTMPNLDLKEANVLDVSISPLGGGNYRFDVTLIHDDDGEAPSFADRWVVEDLAGNRLGERILLHAHGNDPFTRSETIHIPETVDVVLIRGHDARHGFGGKALQLNLRDGSTFPVADRDED